MHKFTILPALAGFSLLAACATGGVDEKGNEAPSFDVPTSQALGPVTHYAANTRPELITYCHDQRGFLSTDGLNCAIKSNRTADFWCIQATVRGQDGDRHWLNAICNGWRPGFA